MALTSRFFREPPDQRLEDCLVQDSKHITPGSQGEHVRRIQIALNQVSEGPGKENFFLVMDGKYGPRTASAVKIYKNRRGILQPWQTAADDIVGKRTLATLDDEMRRLEESRKALSQYISFDHFGPPHDHSRCPPPSIDGEIEHNPVDKTLSHLATPINPLRFGKMVNIGGVFEAVGFLDFVPDPMEDPSMRKFPVKHRFLTSELEDHSVSDICFRSTPIDKYMRDKEIQRICMVGARLTHVGDPSGDLHKFFTSAGVIMEQGRIPDPSILKGYREYTVVTVLNVVDGDKNKKRRMR
jgi:hypothetical protein